MIAPARLRLALVVGATLALLSCTERTPAGPGADADLVGSLLGPTGLLRCSPLAADSVTQTIGPAGGTLSVGPHQLTVPAGALLEPTTITAVAPSDTVNAVRFQPEGLVFLQPSTLSMSYANCDLQGSVAPKQIVYVDDALNVLVELGSSDDALSQRVTSQLQHFSTYAIAW
jgi:hypothetical protein